MMPDDRRYSEAHQWVKKLKEDDEFLLGVTSHLLRQLGTLIYLDLPDVSDEVMRRLPYGEIESDSGIHVLYPPMDGGVIDVNESILDRLDVLFSDPLEEGWLIKIKGHRPEQYGELLDAAAYEEVARRKKE